MYTTEYQSHNFKTVRVYLQTLVSRYSIVIVFFLLMSCDGSRHYAYRCFELGQQGKNEFEKLVISISKHANLTFEDTSLQFTKRQQESGVVEFVSTTPSKIRILSTRFDFGNSTICLYESEAGVYSEEIRKLSNQVQKLIEQSGIQYTEIQTKPEQK